MTFRDDPSYYESCYCCGDDAIGMTGLCHSCHESAETVEQMNDWINVFINNQVEQGFDRHLFIEYGVNAGQVTDLISVMIGLANAGNGECSLYGLKVFILGHGRELSPPVPQFLLDGDDVGLVKFSTFLTEVLVQLFTEKL